MRARDRADASAGVASTAVDEVDVECAVCGNAIPAGKEYTVAAYGPVHTEPCSHEGKASPADVPLV